jgi:hypothetical protein
MSGQPIASHARRHALRFLAGSPDGCTEAVMLAHGFALGFLADLVNDGLVSEHAEWIEDGRPMEIVRMRITDTGLSALAEN